MADVSPDGTYGVLVSGGVERGRALSSPSESFLALGGSVDERIFNMRAMAAIDASRFGVLKNGGPSRVAIQAAIDYAAERATGCVQYGGYAVSVAVPTVELPAGGSFEIEGDDGLLLPPYVRLVGNTTHLFSHSSVAPIISANGYIFECEGIIFSGGNGHVKLTGSPYMTNGMRARFSNCRFNRTKTGAYSLVFEPADPAWAKNRSLSMFLTMRGCYHDGCLALLGGADDILIEDEIATWTVNDGPWIDSAGSLRVKDVQGVPIYAKDESGNNITSDNPWIRHSGSLECRGFRFGGENGGARILHYHASTEYYDDIHNDLISFRSNQIHCTGKPWAIFEGNFPILDVGPNTGFAPDAAIVDSNAESGLASPPHLGLTCLMDTGSCGFASKFVRPDGSVIHSISAVMARGRTSVAKATQQANLLPAGVRANVTSYLGLESDGEDELLGSGYKATREGGGAYLATDSVLFEIESGVYCLSMLVRATKGCDIAITGISRNVTVDPCGGTYRKLAFVFNHHGGVVGGFGLAIEGVPLGEHVFIGRFELVHGTEPST